MSRGKQLEAIIAEQHVAMGNKNTLDQIFPNEGLFFSNQFDKQQESDMIFCYSQKLINLKGLKIFLLLMNFCSKI